MKEEEHRLLGAIANAMSILVKEDVKTKLVFENIKSIFNTFFKYVQKKAEGAIEIIQTGSSYDDLHITRCVSGTDAQKTFYPPTDFDFMMLYTQFVTDDFTNKSCHTEEFLGDQDIKRAIKSSTSAFLMVSSEHHGYVRLLITDKGREMMQGKRHFESITDDGYFKSNAFRSIYSTEPGVEVIYRRKPFQTDFVSSGPALTSLKHELEGFTYDMVFAFPCRAWPGIAERWSKRPRDAKWPCQSLIDDIVKDVCAVVPVGFYTSENRDLEWRLSFNLSERRLSKALTQNQKICYCIVKLMVKVSLPDTSILSSYMVKNMMFWFCEQQYGIDQWEDSQLGGRIVQLIDYIITALTHHYIPHYFLPRNNLILHKPSEDVQKTIEGLNNLKTVPFTSLRLICNRMHILEHSLDETETIAAADEIQHKLTLFTTFGKILLQMAMIGSDARSFALRCYRLILAMNESAKSMIKVGSHLYTATTIINLLKPYAIQSMQAGEVDKALDLFQTMLEASKDDVLARYPEAVSNITCLQAVILSTVADITEKERLKKSTQNYFEMAIYHIKDSPSLHLAYGNFLKDQRVSLLNAVEQYKAAVAVVCSRSDDDALIQIVLPSTTDPNPKPMYLPGKIVAYCSLIDVAMEIGDVYEARRTANKFCEFVKHHELKSKEQAVQLCCYSYMKVGLQIKAKLFKERNLVKFEED